jgi:hypothetical protein
MTFTRWTKADGVLHFNDHEGVSIEWSDSLDGMPFLAHIGGTEKRFDYLQDALDWLEEVAVARDRILGPDPLPVTPDDPTAYLEDKGLRP